MLATNARMKNAEDNVKSCVFAVEIFEEKGHNVISLIFH
jgi:hypothetical protein